MHRNVSQTQYDNFQKPPPKIEYDINELESKSPEELDRILREMEDYSKATYKIYGGSEGT